MSDIGYIGDWAGPMCCFLCGADLNQAPDSDEQISGLCLKCLYEAKVEAGTATFDDHCDVMIDAIKQGDPFAPPVSVGYVEQMRELAKPRPVGQLGEDKP